MTGMYLIEKYGLYYRPDASGYTGLKRCAGLYSYDEAHDRSHPNGQYGPRDGMRIWPLEEAPEFSSECPHDLIALERSRRGYDIIAAVCAAVNDLGFAHMPRIVSKGDFDLSEFKEQPSDIEGVDREWIRQTESMVPDSFSTTIAVDIGHERLFVVDCET